MTDQLEIFCDESGHTGAALLDPAQRYFAFSSVTVSDIEAERIIGEARSHFPVQMPELKASRLFRSRRGTELIGFILSRLEDKYAVTVHDKVMALCAQFYEYVYEPVFKASPWFLYSKKMHLSVATYLFVWSSSHEADAEQALREFQSYLRSLDPTHAPLLFGRIERADSNDRDPLDSILRFARLCRDRILRDNAVIPQQLPAEGRWLGDLATTSLWTHLNRWGTEGLPIVLTCDSNVSPGRAGGFSS